MIFRFLPKLLYAIGGCLYLFTFGLFSASNRYRVYEICTLLGWDRKRRAELLPKIPVSKVLADPLDIRLYNPAPRDGNVTFLELAIMTHMVKTRKVERIFEIGTFDGRTARNLAAAMPESGRVLTLDLPAGMAEETEYGLAKGEVFFVKKESSGSQFAGTPEEKKITQLLGDSGKFDYGPYVGKMDMVFIDGSHAYDYVWSDTMNALKLLKPEGGLIFWHDYAAGWPDTTHAVNEPAAKEPRLKGMRHIEGTALAFVEIAPK